MADLHELMRVANLTRSLYDDPAFRRVYEKMYGGALDAIRHSLPDESTRREEAYWRLRTLTELDQELAAAMAAPGIEAKKQDRQR